MSRRLGTEELLRLLLTRLIEPRPTPRPQQPKVITVVVRVGRVHSADHPEQEYAFMVMGKPGQRVALTATAYQADGATVAQYDGAATFRFEPEGLVELRADEATGAQYAYLVAPGRVEVTVEVDGDLGPSVRLLADKGVIDIIDPATQAETVRLTLGEAEDVAG